MNFIGFINGSYKQIPANAEFDLIGQAIKQNKTLEHTTIAELRAFENQSIISLSEQIQFDRNVDGTVISGISTKQNKQSITQDMKKLFLDKHVAPVFFKSILMYTVSINLSMLSMFHVTHMGGNIFHNLIIIGIGYGGGMVLSGMIL